MPKISILIPAYNVEPYIARCLDSVLAQTFADFEAIVVDDGSSDRTLGIIDEYVARDSRIKVIHQENSGVLWARKVAIEASSGHFIMFADSDDELTPNACERLLSLISQSAADMVVAGYESIDKDGVVTMKSCELPYGDDAYGFAMAMAMDRMKRYLWSRIYRRELLTGHDIEYRKGHNACDDQYILYQIAPYINKVVCVPDPLYKYYYNPRSLTRFFHHEKNMRDVLETHKMSISMASSIDSRIKVRTEYNAIKDVHYWIKTGCPRRKVMDLVSEHGLGHLFSFTSLLGHLGWKKAVTYFMVTRFGPVARIVYGNNWNRTK